MAIIARVTDQGVGVKLVNWRQEKGLTQRQLADALGCTQPAISDMERFDRNGAPNPDLVLRIYRLTRGAVTPNDFYDLPTIDQLDLPIGEPSPAPLFEGAN